MRSRSTRIRLGIGGALGLLWASQGVFGAISTAVNHAWAVERPRSFWRHRWFSLLMMSTAVLLLFIALLVLSASKATRDALVGVPVLGVAGVAGAVGGWGNRLTTFLLFVVDCRPDLLLRAQHDRAAPRRLARRRADGPALARGLRGFSWYVRSWARASVHGSIATVVWFLIWIYISAVILLYGVEFTAAIARHPARAPRTRPCR